jgi:hypothetical protein
MLSVGAFDGVLAEIRLLLAEGKTAEAFALAKWLEVR